MKLSLVVPVYNEEENLPELLPRIYQAVEPLGMDWDLTLVDDGSKDNSAAVLRQMAADDQAHVRAVILNRN
jgi:undecaprenyl-phosphate 4-deoxy-4-formamido-L-arabinose transferase